ncbi:threonine--tRNA ligase, partial [Candidatus Woesebacteria bacterium]|nr:threonine--tRNA ligase [Candidatus Woesebacteria bacterium]
MDQITDHKKIGQIQDLFLISQEVGSGFPIFAPNGLIIRDEIENYITQEKKRRGYLFVWTPHVAKSELYKKSGHWQKFESMFPPIKLDEEEYVLKPMNCPHHFQIYLNRPRSYRELPLRIAENGTVYRYEKSGEVNGLLRVRSLSIDDTHTFLKHDQIEREIDQVLDLVEAVFKTFGFSEYRAQISVRDPKTPKKYLGDASTWKGAEEALIAAAKKRKMKSSIEKGEAAFYGPKIDFMVKDSLGREWQLATCQLDFNQPNNFDMEFVNEKGQKERPAILHIAILGSIERFMGILIEHLAGNFPVWLAPIQVKVLPITEKNLDYANRLDAKLNQEGIRSEVDERNETLPAKIRDAQTLKVPYMLIVGDKEEKAKKVAVRLRNAEDLGQVSLENFAERVKEKIEKKGLDL